MPSILTDATAAYLEEMQPPADEIVSEMEAQAEEESIPIADRSVAHLQAILARAMDADRALEFGTAIGYSTLHVARAGCDVVTLELDPDRIEDAGEYLWRAGVRSKVEILEGPALETLGDVEGPFDLLFLDAVKTEYEQYLERALPMLRPGGMVLVDNLLWHGQVPTEPTSEDYVDSTEALREFNETFLNHPDLDAIISPLGDGTGIATKLE